MVPLGAVPHNLGEYTGFALLKMILTAGLGLLWFLVILAMTRVYVRASVRRLTPRPSS